MNKLRFGILGAGYMAGVHCKNLSKIKNTEIVAICDVVGKPEGLMKDYGISNYYQDFNQMVDSEKLDVVVVTIPPFAHNGQVEYAASKGIHIFIEKPVAINSDRAKSMVTAIKKAGVKSGVGYHYRFGGAVQKLVNMINSGEAGKVTLFDARFECNSLHANWWRDITKSGGQILEQIIHLYDMGMFLGGKATSVVAYTENLCHQDVENYTVEDTSAAIITYKNGGLGSIVGTNCAVQMEWNAVFSVVCKNVTVHFKDPNNAEFIYTNGEEPVKETFSGTEDPYFEEMKAFIDQIKGIENSYTADIEQGYYGVELVELATKSNGNRIAIDG